ncbi:MAG TPA: hypothetical protein VIY51_24390 [Xanthobacteraceae bacterium]
MEVADAFYEELKGLGPQEILDETPQPMKPGQSPQSGPLSGKVLIQRAHQLCSMLAPALQSLRKARGGQRITAGECLKLAGDLRRYSFNRYQ